MTTILVSEILYYNDWKVISLTDFLRIGNLLCGGEFMRLRGVGNKEWKILMQTRLSY